jgi:hypothetical protein
MTVGQDIEDEMRANTRQTAGNVTVIFNSGKVLTLTVGNPSGFVADIQGAMRETTKAVMHLHWNGRISLTTTDISAVFQSSFGVV